MKKLLLIIQREYFSRVKKKSFLVMTILGPLLMAGVFIVPIWLSIHDTSLHRVEVIDQSGIFINELKDNEQVKFTFRDEQLAEAKHNIQKGPFDIVMVIPPDIINGKGEGPILYYNKQPGIGTEQYISNSMENILFDYRLQGDSIDASKLANARQPVKVRVIKVNELGQDEETNTETNIYIGFAGAIIIYFMIFLYGAQVMNGVIEEKTSRIVEVIISSVKPFQLMLGKILGVALVGLTQFVLWIVLTVTISSTLSSVLFKDAMADQVKRSKQLEQVYHNDITSSPDKMQKLDTPNNTMDILGYLGRLKLGKMLFCFGFYFLFGYLLYAALFAAIGSAVDSEADKQQFMLPVTIPLILSFAVAQGVIANPDGPVAYWFSIIPLTSPIVMMVRLPFDVPISDVITSMVLLVAGFFFFTWLAGKIYRTGILMYGKKVSWRELGKWLFYK